MIKFSKIAALMVCFAAAAHAQLKGVGYDTDLSQVTARLGLGANLLDVGAGLRIDSDNPNDDAKFQVSGSAFFLGHLHDWGPVDTYFTVGGIFAKLPQADDNIKISIFGGFQPEITLLDHIVVSTRFGLDFTVLPGVVIETAGGPISIVNGLNFKILF